jgi:hypothetical protein
MTADEFDEHLRTKRAEYEKRALGLIRAGEQKRRDARDRAIIDANAERLNAEALDALDYQAGAG